MLFLETVSNCFKYLPQEGKKNEFLKNVSLLLSKNTKKYEKILEK